MSRIPQSDELIEGEDCTDPEFVQLESEHTDDEYTELNFDSHIVSIFLDPEEDTDKTEETL